MRPIPSPPPGTRFLQGGPISLRFQDFSNQHLLWEAFPIQVIRASQISEKRMMFMIF